MALLPSHIMRPLSSGRTLLLASRVIPRQTVTNRIFTQQQFANRYTTKSDSIIERAVSGNRSFAQRFKTEKAELIQTLSAGQSPDILWIGCADSRVPETTVCDCQPGDIFVHRNIANCLHPNDLSSQAAIEFSVGVLKVKEIIVCGHTKCGGAAGALGDDDLGETLNTWLAPLRELRRKNQAELDKLGNDADRAIRLAELNVQNGLEVLSTMPTVQKAIKERGLTIHGAIYDIAEAELRVLEEKS